jgi:integrase
MTDELSRVGGEFWTPENPGFRVRGELRRKLARSCGWTLPPNSSMTRASFATGRNNHHLFRAVGGIDGVRQHDLRHSCAALAISEGANITVVQRLLGHKSAVLTLDRYGHLFPDDLDAVASAFDTAAGALRAEGASRPLR